MNEVVIKGLYKHFKGNIYIVEDIALDCENLDEMIVYRDINHPKKLWIRKKDDFLSEVDHDKYPKVKQKYRFELIKID